MSRVNYLDKITDVLTPLVDLPIYQGQMPNDPDNIILLNWGRGSSGSQSFGNNFNNLDYPLITARVRHKSYDSALNYSQDFCNIIRKQETISQVQGLISVTLEGNIGYYLRDMHERYEFLATYGMVVVGI